MASPLASCAAARAARLRFFFFFFFLYWLPLATPFLASAAPADAVSDAVAAVSRDRIAASVAALEGERSSAPQRAAAADAIETALDSYGYVVARDVFQTGTNVVAWLPGVRESKRLVVIGAHYDTVAGSPGAADDASGIAALLEIARVLAESPRRDTIEFVAFDRGEVAREGSFQHAYTLLSAERVISGMIALESVGYTCDTPGCQAQLVDPGPGCFTSSAAGVDVGDYLSLVVNDASSALLAAYAAAAAQYAPSLRVETARVAGTGSCLDETRSGDHASFWDFELPGMMASDTGALRNPNVHQPTDVASTLDLDFTTDVARATTAWAAILAPEPGGMLTAGVAFAAVAALRASVTRRRRPSR